MFSFLRLLLLLLLFVVVVVVVSGGTSNGSSHCNSSRFSIGLLLMHYTVNSILLNIFPSEYFPMHRMNKYGSYCFHTPPKCCYCLVELALEFILEIRYYSSRAIQLQKM